MKDREEGKEIAMIAEGVSDEYSAGQEQIV